MTYNKRPTDITTKLAWVDTQHIRPMEGKDYCTGVAFWQFFYDEGLTVEEIAEVRNISVPPHTLLFIEYWITLLVHSSCSFYCAKTRSVFDISKLSNQKLFKKDEK